MLRWTEWVVCVSQAQADQLRKRRKGHRAPLVISNAALFLAQDVLVPIDRLPIRRTLGLCEEAFLVCVVGRLSVEKGHRYLLYAIPHLIERIPKLQVLVLGEGAERRRLEEEVARMGVQNFVAFAGFQSDVRPWMQACDVLVNSSLTEGMPNVILEAMAFGTPVVATRVGGVPELLQHKETGILVPPADTPSLANAIYDLFANPAEALRLACKAQIGAQDYAPAKQDQRLLDLYARALQVPRQELADHSAILPTQG
jgi:glycosyltransferase involved in cell wall biosynthesis